MIVVAGEAIIDLVQTSRTEFTAHPGGAPANVAVTLARLGVEAQLLARLSSDRFGEILRAHVLAEGVKLDRAVTVPELTSLAISTLDDDGAAAYAFYIEGTADWHWLSHELPATLLADAHALYVGSLAMAVPPASDELTRLAGEARRSGQCVIAYDPNLRPSLLGDLIDERARVSEQVSVAHVVKASEEDLRLLYADRPASDVAAEWQEICGGLVIVTAGSEGCRAVGPAGLQVSVPGVHATVVDTIGAGDAFMGGLLASLQHRRMLDAGPAALFGALTPELAREVLAEANLVAALSCERPGPNPPTWPDVEKARVRIAANG